MRKSTSRILKWLAIVCGGAVLFQFPITGNNGVGGGGCLTFASNGLMTSLDFCYLLDCDNGFFGGAIKPCGDGSTVNGQPYLLDCQAMATSDTGGSQAQGGSAAQQPAFGGAAARGI